MEEETQLVCITSHTSDSSTTFTHRLHKPIGHAANIRLVHAVLPNSIYTISEHDCEFLFNFNLIRIPHGYYTCVPDVLGSVLPMLQVVDPSVKVFQDVSTRRVHFRSQSHIRIRFESSLHHLFGFPNGESCGYQSLQGGYPATVVFHRSTWFKIRCPELASVLPDNGLLDIVARNETDTITFEASHEHKKRRFAHEVDLSTITIQLTDEHDTPLELNGVNATVVLECTLHSRHTHTNRSTQPLYPSLPNKKKCQNIE